LSIRQPEAAQRLKRLHFFSASLHARRLPARQAEIKDVRGALAGFRDLDGLTVRATHGR
jgi:hypothetical protein